MTRSELQVANTRLAAENHVLRRAIEDCWWCARRYCDGCRTGICSDYNAHTRALLARGVLLRKGLDGTLWARDPMGRQYDGLTDAEAAEGKLCQPA